MDERQTENPIPTDRLDNTNLPVITANLEMLTIDTNPPPTETKRLLRKRIPKPVTTEILNRRIPTDRLDNTNLPVITANLEMLTMDTKPPPAERERLLRKRIPKPVTTEILNRRCSLRPKKRRISEMEAQEETIKEYYLDKSINKKSNNLETIYEENDNAGDDTAIRMSAKRFKRMLMFSPTASKLKKRRAKIQKVFGSKITYKRCGSMQALVDKLNTIRESSPMKIDSELK